MVYGAPQSIDFYVQQSGINNTFYINDIPLVLLLLRVFQAMIDHSAGYCVAFPVILLQSCWLILKR